MPIRFRSHAFLFALPALFAGTGPGGVQPLHAQEVIQAATVRAPGVEVSFDGLVQTQFNTSSLDRALAVGDPDPGSGNTPDVDGPRVNDTELLLRRVRLGATARIGEWIIGRIQPEFSTSTIELNEAYLLLQLNPGLEFLAGKGGRPFGLIDATVAPRLIPIERGARIRGIQPLELYGILEELAYAGRSVGVQILGAPEGAPLDLSYSFGYFNGALAESGGEADIEQLAGRVTVRPLEQVQIGGAITSRLFTCENSDDTAGCTGGGADRGASYLIDAQYGESGRAGLYLLGELATGVFDPFTNLRFRGGQLWLAYRTPPVSDRLTGIQPLFRVSYGDLDDQPSSPTEQPGVATGTLFTPGINVYLGGLNRVMFNYDLWSPDGADTEGSFEVQFQLGF